jgi:deoxyadenosine/deoxycytidine kinase
MLKNHKKMELYFPKFISVEGNIGSGKSTFLKKLSESINCKIAVEPCKRWQDVGGYNLLEAFYKDSNRWGYTFQSYVFLTRIQALEKMFEYFFNNLSNDMDYFISERFVLADLYVFAKTSYDLGIFNKIEWEAYCNWYLWMIKKYVPIPSGFIYLRVMPEVAYNRINIRARGEESEISIDYLKMIHNCHENWMIHKKFFIETGFSDIPVLVIDCNKDFEHNIIEWNIILEKTKSFIYCCCNRDSFLDSYCNKA